MRIISVLLLSIVTTVSSGQTIFFDITEVFSKFSDGKEANFIVPKEGVFKLSKENKIIIYGTNANYDTLVVQKTKESDENSLIIYCERDYIFILFEDFVVIRKIFYKEKSYLLMEQRLFSLNRRI